MGFLEPDGGYGGGDGGAALMAPTPVAEMDVTGRRLVVRADLNVPMEGGTVRDATRIDRFAEGMRPLLGRGARLVILAHLGRPKGRAAPELSLHPLREPLAAALGTEVLFCPESTGAAAEAMAAGLKDGQAMLAENVRFHPGEEANDPDLAAAFARLGDIYVNDGFSVSHRAHASTEGIAHRLPAAAGPMMMDELRALSAALEQPARPALAIVGGAKVSTKIDVLKNLVARVDAVIIGGGMANTFLHADGAPMGKSLHEADQDATVAEIRRRAADAGCMILLPTDAVVARALEPGADAWVVPADACPDDATMLDAGPESVARFEAAIAGAATILWNGPVGAFEVPPFDTGTMALARAAASRTLAGATSVAGGGDTAAALNAAGVADDFSYVSAAGGAFLEWLEGRTLPGVAALG
jgi:phosphoglycerate kinase